MSDSVVVMRLKPGAAVPSWLVGLDGVERLRDGAFLVPAGRFDAQDVSGAAVRQALPHDLSAHDDARGLRWMKLTAIPPRRIVDCELEGHGRFKAYALDYEACVAAAGGVWVATKPTVVPRKASVTADEPSHRNVVVVRKAPARLPKELIVLARLADGTALAVGPRNRGWVDWLKKNVPAEHLRLIRGPVPASFFADTQSFEMLDAACRLQGQPMLVMKSE